MSLVYNHIMHETIHSTESPILSPRCEGIDGRYGELSIKASVSHGIV